MNFRSKRSTAVALLLVFATSQIYLGVTFAGAVPASTGAASAGSIPQQVTAILSTRGNKPVSVNGASAVSGTTILTGATIETPDQYGAIVDLPRHGKLEIAPKTKLTLEFDQQGIKVTLIHGCVVLRTKKGTTGDIVTEQGAMLGKSDGSKDAVLSVCDPTTSTAPAAAAGGLAKWKIAAIILGGTAVLIPIVRGTNPSP